MDSTTAIAQASTEPNASAENTTAAPNPITITVLTRDCRTAGLGPLCAAAFVFSNVSMLERLCARFETLTDLSLLESHQRELVDRSIAA